MLRFNFDTGLPQYRCFEYHSIRYGRYNRYAVDHCLHCRDNNPLIYATGTRTMTRVGGGSLPFNLSQTSLAPTDALPSTAGTGEVIGSSWTADGAPHAVTIFGRIPATSFSGQPVGTYSATIVISIDYS